jgi:hypothetical protein
VLAKSLVGICHAVGEDNAVQVGNAGPWMYLFEWTQTLKLVAWPLRSGSGMAPRGTSIAGQVLSSWYGVVQQNRKEKSN